MLKVNPVQIQPAQSFKANSSESKSEGIPGVIANVRKGVNSVDEISKGVIGGAAKGVIVGAGAFTAFWGLRAFKNNQLGEMFKTISSTFAKGFSKIPEAISSLGTVSFAKTLKGIFVDAPKKALAAFKNTEVISKPAKFAVLALSASVFLSNILKSVLNANSMNAGVDHRWKVGHNNK